MGLTLVLDGDHIIHRNLYLPKLRQLQTDTGYPTGVIFGVMNVLNNLVQNCFDKPVTKVFFLIGKEGRDNWRNDVFGEYKEKTQDDIDQWHTVPEGEDYSYNELYRRSRHALVKHLPDLGIRVTSAYGHEADDLSYIISKKLKERGEELIAVSGDNDWLQLVNDPGIPVYQPIKEEMVTEDNFEEHTGVPPEAMVLHLSVLGGHDNIPKVQYRFGEKSSMKMIEELDSYDVESVAKWAENQSAKTYKKLALDDRKEQLKTNIKLVDFSKVPFSDEVKKQIQEELDKEYSFNYDRAEIFIKKYQLNKFASILGRKTFKALR